MLCGMLLPLCAAAQLSAAQSAMVQFVHDHRGQQIQLLEQLVNLNSGTSNADGVRQVGERLKPQFEALGFDVQWHDLPENMRHAGSLVATLGAHPGKRMLLIGHLDTVFSRDSPFQRFTVSEDGRKASGPGVIDDKGGLVTILFALQALHQTGGLKNANLTVVLVGDEELAAQPTEVSRKALADAAKNSDMALGFEFGLSPDELVVGRRGLSEWLLRSTGAAQHSSTIFQPAVGFGAAFEVSRVLNELRGELSRTPGLTINPGLLLGGQKVREEEGGERGVASGKKTIVAGQALVRGDLRFSSDDQRDSAEQAMLAISSHALPGTASSVEFRRIMPVMAATSANQQLLAEYSAVSENLGGPPLRAIAPETRGGADISYIAQYVAASLDGLGPWGAGAHGEQETLDLDSLEVATTRAALFLARQISGGATK